MGAQFVRPDRRQSSNRPELWSARAKNHPITMRTTTTPSAIRGPRRTIILPVIVRHAIALTSNLSRLWLP
jgi:hypothetical protein